MRTRTLLLIVLGAYLLPPVTVLAAEEVKVEPELPPNPEVAQMLAELGDNDVVRLPEAELVGEFNALARRFELHGRGPGRRNFSIKMVWAPERGRALFAGANHGAPHRLNDMWEYDLQANTWILLHPPDFNASRNNRDLNDEVVLRDGFPATKGTGAPVHLGHTWWQFTYDPNLRAALWLSRWPGYSSIPERYDLDAVKLYTGPPMWYYFPEDRRWEPRPAAGGWAPRVGMGDTLEYISDLEASFYSRGGWLYDAAENRWQSLQIQGDAPPIETVMVYDEKNQVLVAHRGVPADYRGREHDPTKRTWHFDFRTSTWEQVVTSEDAPSGHDGWTPFVYDSVNGVSLMFDPLEDEGSIWAYDAAKREWTRMTESDIPGSTKGYFDAKQNAFVLINDRQPWVYRYREK